MGRKLDREKKAQAIAMLQAGGNRKEIAKFLDVTVKGLSAIATRLRRKGVEIPLSRMGRKDTHRCERGIEMLVDGKSRKEIAQALDVSISAVDKWATLARRRGIFIPYLYRTKAVSPAGEANPRTGRPPKQQQQRIEVRGNVTIHRLL